MNKLEYVIIEDEPLALNRLKELLSSYNNLILVGTANNGQKGKDLISETKPDLVFLDIEMPVLNGFEMLANLSQQPKVVFTTAYHHYALKAFEENSIDYLLKPISAERLAKTILKISTQQINSVNWNTVNQQVEEQKPVKKWNSITVNSGNGFKILQLNSVAYFKAEDKYVIAFDLEGKKYLLDKSLKLLNENLPEEFMQIHRGIILNFNTIKNIKKNFRSLFIFVLNDVNASEITCGNSHLKAIKEKLNL